MKIVICMAMMVLCQAQGVAAAGPDQDMQELQQAGAPISHGCDLNAQPTRKRDTGRGRKTDTTEQFGLIAVTANTTCWATAKEFLMQTDAHLVFLQEHKLLGPEIAQASQWADSEGWIHTFTPATTGPGGGASGGVAILSRRGVGLVKTNIEVAMEGRVAAAEIFCPGLPKFLAITTYLVTGLEMTSVNLTLANDVAAYIQSRELPGLWSGDFQSDPQAVEATGILDIIKGKVYTCKGTCTVAAEGTTIDMHIPFGGFQDLIDNVTILTGTNVKTHRPVRLEFLKEPLKLRVRKMRKPQGMGTEKVFGPHLKDTNWTLVTRMALEALQFAENGDSESSLKWLDQTIVNFADQAEEDIIPMTMSDITKKGTRGRKAKMVWANLFQKNEKERFKLSDDLTMVLENTRKLRDITIDLRCIANSKGVGYDIDGYMDTVKQHKWSHTQEQKDSNEYDKAAVEGGSVEMRLTARLKIITMKAHFLQHTTTNGHGYTWEEIADNAAALSADVAELEKTLSTARRKEILGEYKACLTACGKVATKRAFLASQLPQEVVPRDVIDKETGYRTADPVKVLDNTVSKYHKLWHCAEGDVAFGKGPLWGGGTRLGRMAAARIRAASKTFKKKTSITHDGMHPRHFSLLSDEALEALAIIFETMECLGTMSTELRQNLVVLLAKAAGGFRPIGIYTSFERLWTRIRNEEVREWQEKNKKDFLSCSKGSGAADAVWAQSVRAESGIGEHKHIISGFWDMKSFYDCIDHGLLQARSISMQFPQVLMNMALAACTAPRVVQSPEGTSELLFPRRGILAGHGFANAMTQVYYSIDFERFLEEHPGVGLTVYVDDITLTVEHTDRDIAFSLFVQAAKDLAVLVDTKLKSSYAEGKEAILASDEDLARRVREALGPLAGKSVTTTPHLGIDFKAGRKRGSKKKGTVRGKRLQTAARRKKKVKSLRSILGSRVTRHICNAGVIPAAAFGSEVNGLSDRELLIIQQVQGAATAPATSGRSLTASLLATGDDSWRASAAPMRRWQKEAWRAENQDSRAKFTKDELTQAWQSTIKQQHEWYWDDGTARWSQTRGPIGAAILSMERIGWHFLSPVKWVDDMKIVRDLDAMGPKLFDIIVKESTQRTAERSVAKKSGFKCLEGKRACFDVIRNFITAPNRTSKRDKDVVHATACNAIWSKTRLKEAGYDVECTKCELCGVSEDTAFHRIWQCQAPTAVAARTRAAAKGLVRKAIAAGQEDPLYTHGFFPHPGDSIQMPCQEMKSECWHRNGQQGCIDGAVRMHGDIYADGHATRTGINELNRASWAIVEIDHNDDVVAWVRGCVPSHHPQTAQAAEFMAAALTPQICGPNTVLYDDCANVVKQFNKGADNWIDDTKVYAGLMKWAKLADRADNLTGLEKVPAHVDYKDTSLSPMERHHAYGNHMADWHANEAEKLHPKDVEASAKAAEIIETAEAVLRVIAAVLAQWPMTTKQYKRLGSEGRKETQRVPVADKHCWVREQDWWRCTTCRARTRTSTLPKRRSAEKCWGLRDRLARKGQQSLGHDVAEFVTCAGDFSICTRCGRYGIQRARGLAKVCAGEIRRKGARQSWKRVFREGRHPHTGKSITGHCDAQGLTCGIGDMQVRSNKVRKARLKRLTGKTKPWIAAQHGFDTDPTGPIDEMDMHDEIEFHDCNDEAQEQDEYADCEDVFDFGDTEQQQHSSSPTKAAAPEVDDADRERIAKKRKTAMDTKYTRIHTKEFIDWTEGERDWVNKALESRKRDASAMEGQASSSSTDDASVHNVTSEDRARIAANRTRAMAKKRKIKEDSAAELVTTLVIWNHSEASVPGLGGFAPPNSIDPACEQRGFSPNAVTKGPQAFGLETTGGGIPPAHNDASFADGVRAPQAAKQQPYGAEDVLDVTPPPQGLGNPSDRVDCLEQWLEESMEQQAREQEALDNTLPEGQLEAWLEESMEDTQRQEAQEAKDILEHNRRKAPLWAQEPSYSTSSKECWNPLRASDAAAEEAAALTAAAVVRSTILAERSELDDSMRLEASETQEAFTEPQADETQGAELGEEWERSFAAYTARQQRPTGPPCVGEPTACPESDLSSKELEGLIEASEMDLPVCWPSGLDSRVAQAILKARSNISSEEAAASASPPEDVQAENWRHRKRRLQLEKEAATRPRAIPTMEQAMTPAAIKMAKMAAKFRRTE